MSQTFQHPSGELPGFAPFTIELPGRTTAYRVAQVRARVDGIVLKREFSEGSDIKAGQRLYQIDPAPYQATLDSALASLQKAQANVVALNAQAERFKTLLADNGVVWLLTPKAGRPGYVEPSEISESAPTAGLQQTSTLNAGKDWSGARLVSPRGAKKK